MKRARIVLADDHSAILAGLIATFEKDYEISGVFSDGRALAAGVEEIRPDAVVLDIGMPLLNGIDAAAQIKASIPGVAITFFTMHASPAYVAAALRVGASGYVLKTASTEELLFALQRVLAGHIHVPALPGRNSPDSNKPSHVTSYELSPREREVLHLIAQGRAAKEIAYLLMISTRTVSFHRANIQHKLGVASTAGLTRYAMENLV